MQLKTIDSTITVPVPDHKEIRMGTLQSIIRQSGLQNHFLRIREVIVVAIGDEDLPDRCPIRKVG